MCIASVPAKSPAADADIHRGRFIGNVMRTSS